MRHAPASSGSDRALREGDRLPAWALFSGLIATAGLPIYIHAPKFYVDEYGLSLSALAAALFALRLLDVVQDPALGWLAERLRARRAEVVGVAGSLMALAMVGLFAVTPPVAPLLWFALTLAVLFSSFSMLTITFYAQGVAKAEALTGKGHLRLAGWREAGALVGVSLAAVAPVVLATTTEQPFTRFALGFAALAVVALWAMRDQWQAAPLVSGTANLSLRPVLADATARRLLVLALFNAAPAAVTSTLFLFFVESRLEAPGWEGPLLLLFFLCAAVSSPFWSKLAERFGEKPVLLAAMCLAIVAFVYAAAIGSGDVLPFALICAASGAAMGADLTLLPALFARRMAQISPQAGAGFGLWTFVSKLTLAFAAVSLLPLLEAAGFQPGASNTDAALQRLSVLYAIVPCGLKLISIALLGVTHLPEDPR